MKRALLLDFEDSFTFNLVQEIDEIGILVHVIHWQNFSGTEDFDLLILGPGPGHPDDYQYIFPLLDIWLRQGKKIFGVCLGHQIIWKFKGLDIIPSRTPTHGHRVDLPISKEVETWLKQESPLKVQRYNSLAVRFSPSSAFELWVQVDDELMLAKDKQIISYQFHPESMGTNCRKSFFLPILKDLL